VLHGWDTKVNYSAAKAGVVGLVKGAAVELGPHGIRVNAVAPGLTRTAQSLGPDSHGPEGVAAIARKIPLRRAAEPEDIGNIIAFLASDRSFFITGQTIVADGGFAAGNYR
jgi:3-oxoacyl-[acyl-carrier protein] reductase